MASNAVPSSIFSMPMSVTNDVALVRKQPFERYVRGSLMKRCARLSWIASTIATLMLSALAASPAHADFFDGARQTFQNDIPHFFTQSVPHFFQDDIPCAVVGHPTSGTTKSCNQKPDTNKGKGPEEPPANTDQHETTPPSSSQQ